MKKIGYARVSTRDQNLDMQLHALKEAGCEQIFTEKKSGRKMDRPILKKLIKQSSAGDTIIVWIHIPEHTRSLSGSLLGYKTIP